MSGKALHYFAGDHTAKGFYQLYESNFSQLNHAVSLKSKLKSTKSIIMQQIADDWLSKGDDVEFIHSSSFLDGLDGVINSNLQRGVYDGDLVHAGFEGEVKTYHIDHECFQQDLEINPNQEKMYEYFQKAQDSFEKGLDIHDGLEEIYINQMNFDQANQVTNRLITEIFQHTKYQQRQQSTKHRFFGASTAKGVIDFIPNLTDGLNKRYLIKGRAGTGKSTLLKKVAREAENKGYDVEVYHCGFDPESIDMVVIRQLSTCLFDSTDPHEYFPEQDGDVIVDLYRETVAPGTDEKFAKAIEILTNHYKGYMKIGAGYLFEANKIHLDWEERYTTCLDDKKIAEFIDKFHHSS
ncbi:hypothetical protein CR194_09720 [Salipaludibacillus keqinensis]|uniref:ATPase n=1 Tax=Salipaludibacillus keqinensis TaxID=2045207 RepID=A0A323TDH3_9BACI|nr:hypothetical protein [Salipaludibacillus keqinensis]PYZ93442.1 hypothetical protein CR194_09720 [Salipaludibacillus keqinensis]